jgi:hypothetical protein
VAQAIEALHLRVGVTPDGVIVWEPLHELPHARPELVREMGRCRADEGVDVVAGWLGHRAEI